MSQDEQTISLLGTFHFILGILVVAFASIYLAFVFVGVMILKGGFGGPAEQPAMGTADGWMFIGIGTAIVLVGWSVGALMIVAGSRLKRHISRTFCLVVAGVECIVTPLGTALGVCTIVVLQKESVIALFDRNATADPLKVQ